MTVKITDKRAGSLERRIPMPAVIDADNREIEDDAPIWVDWWNSFSNLTVEYYMKWGDFPRYAYVNTRTWEHANNEMTRQWASGLSVEVLTHEKMPWDVVAMHHHRYDPRDVALHYRKYKPWELEQSGKAVIV